MAVLLAAVLAGTAPAGATGNFDCSIADKRVAFSVEGLFSHGLGSSFSNVRATLELKAEGVPPALAKLELDGAALVHHWLHGKELRLHFYHDLSEAPFGSVELVLRARAVDADAMSFAGRYELTVASPGADGAKGRDWTFKGKATCSAG